MMNAQKLLIIATLTILLGQMSLKAGEAVTMSNAKKDLTEQIWSIVKRAPFELLSSDVSNDLTIKFRINENGELTCINVEGKNESIARYVKVKMEDESFRVASILAGNNFMIPVSFEELS